MPDDLPGIHFFVDEHVPVYNFEALVSHRGHRITPVQISFKDPAILRSAEEVGAVVVTADVWFLRELYRLPHNHRYRFRRAGVVQLPGEWGIARPKIEEYLPMIELIWRQRQEQANARMGIDLSGTEIRIKPAG